MMKLEAVENQKQWEPSHTKKYMVKTYAFQVSNGEPIIPENLKLFVKLFITNTTDDEVGHSSLLVLSSSFQTMKSKELEKKAAEWLRNRLQLLLMYDFGEQE